MSPLYLLLASKIVSFLIMTFVLETISCFESGGKVSLHYKYTYKYV